MSNDKTKKPEIVKTPALVCPFMFAVSAPLQKCIQDKCQLWGIVKTLTVLPYQGKPKDPAEATHIYDCRAGHRQ